MQTAIPCYLMRGGTSKGTFFLESDLPVDVPTRDRVLLAVMGSPDKRQIDGLGGAHPLTSKVGIVRKSSTAGVDLDFLFAQLQPDKDTVDTTPNCGNMLAAVVPFAIERGIIKSQGTTTTARVITLNTSMQCDVMVHTPNGHVAYQGDARIDGVPGTSAPITINFLDTAGSVCAGLLPTGKVKDTVQVLGQGFEAFSVDVTCIDNGMPLVIMRAADMGRTGYESVAELNADVELKTKLEALRLQVSQLMGLGDVTHKNYPKMTLIAAPKNAIGVRAAVTVGTACVLQGSVCDGIAVVADGALKIISVEHPTGEFSVELEIDPANPQTVTKAALLRTARLIMRGEVMVPASVWAGR
jgi:4-oxalomesaconate tautomerase